MIKKTACLLTAAFLLILCACPALSDVSAYYADERVTVFTDETDLWEILIDGVNIYRFVGGGLQTTSFTYFLDEQTEHVIQLISLDGEAVLGSSCTVRFGPTPAPTPTPEPTPSPAPTETPVPDKTPRPTKTPKPAETPKPTNTPAGQMISPAPSPESTVLPTDAPTSAPTSAPTPIPTSTPTAAPIITAAPAPTAAPRPTATPGGTATPVPKGPVAIESVSYENRAVQFTVSGLRNYSEIWIDGQIVNRLVTENGPFSVALPLATGSHTLTLYVPAVHEAAQKNFQAVFAPDPVLVSSEVLDGVAREADGAALRCKASWDSKNGENTLLLSAGDGSSAAVEYSLTPEQIAAWRAGGFHVLGLQNGSARLMIRLDQMGPGWFGVQDVTRYKVSLRPVNEKSVQLTVSALAASGDAAARVLTGVRLVIGGSSMEVRENGVY